MTVTLARLDALDVSRPVVAVSALHELGAALHAVAAADHHDVDEWRDRFR